MWHVRGDRKRATFGACDCHRTIGMGLALCVALPLEGDTRDLTTQKEF